MAEDREALKREIAAAPAWMRKSALKGLLAGRAELAGYLAEPRHPMASNTISALMKIQERVDAIEEVEAESKPKAVAA